LKTVSVARSTGNIDSVARVGNTGAVGDPIDGKASGVGFGLTGFVSDTALTVLADGSIVSPRTTKVDDRVRRLIVDK
jgi:hypothetical protein